MVDIDRIKDKFKDKKDGGKKKDSSNGGNKKRKKKKAKKTKKKKETKKSKLDKIKGTTSNDGAIDSQDEDVKRLVFCIANMNMFTELVSNKSYDNMKKADKNIKTELLQEMSGEVVGFIGVYEVQNIAEKYGYGWSGLLDHIRSNQDMDGEMMKTNSNNVSKSDIKDCLDCIANCYLYAEGTKTDLENRENRDRKENVRLFFSNLVYEGFGDIISKCQVQKISERWGYDWKEDIIMGVMGEETSYDNKMKEWGM